MNPFHDPKTGRFTSASGGSGGGGLVRSIKGPGPKGTIKTGQKPKFKEQKGGELSKALRGQVRRLHQVEQDRLYRMGGDVAGSRLIRTNLRKGTDKLKAQSKNIKTDPNTKVSDVLRGSLRNLARSEARILRETDKALKEFRAANRTDIVKNSGRKQRRLKGK